MIRIAVCLVMQIVLGTYFLFILFKRFINKIFQLLLHFLLTNCFNLNSCLGPENSVSPNGCITCNKAIVDNDDAYTIIKCIGDIDCELGYYLTIVPKLRPHLLQNKLVCRKCHNECVNCYGDGSSNCYSCQNYNSSRNNQCVTSCSPTEEFLDTQANVYKINFLPLF